MQKRDFYPTIKDFKEMNLNDYQINELIRWENLKHGFRNQYGSLSDFSKPHSIFFLDIKDTLYHSKGHGGNGILGRSNDSLQLSMMDILSLVRLLKSTFGQSLTMDSYNLDQTNNSKIKYIFPQDINTAKYKMDIPTKTSVSYGLGIKHNCTNSGPFKAVFISTDDIQTQKNIILFLLLIEEMWQMECMNIYFHKKTEYIDSQVVMKLEELFEASNCDLNVFVSNLPEKYKSSFSPDKINKIQDIMNRITFLSTVDSNLSKVDLMQNYLDKYNIENRLNYDDYNIFACGDDYIDDGPMINLAFLLGGYGCLNSYGFIYTNSEELLRRDLYNKYGFITNLPMSSYSFSDFYNKAMDRLSLQRTWDLAETMQDINNSEKMLILNRFKKTNHYIEVVKSK